MYGNQVQFTGYTPSQPTSRTEYSPWEFENTWGRTLCDCSGPCEETCYGVWCCPCFSCQLAWRLNESCWLVLCIPAYLATLRTKMRTQFRIRGSYFSDCCAAQFCPCCSALQMAHELRVRKVMS